MGGGKVRFEVNGMKRRVEEGENKEKEGKAVLRGGNEGRNKATVKNEGKSAEGREGRARKWR